MHGIDFSEAAVTNFSPVTGGNTNDASIRNLLSGSKWGTGIGASVSLTTSFSSQASVYSYQGSGASQVQTFTAAQISGARLAMDAIEAIAGISFVEVTDSATLAGDIRWGQTSSTVVPTAEAYYPSASAVGGDIWFGPTNSSHWQNPVKGTYGYLTYLHELGHALGLKHPHESGSVTPEPGEDQLKYSVMSYRDFAGDNLAGYGSSFFPTSLMLNDIAALQFLYGANMTYATGNTTYSWSATSRVYETIWDAGGIDMIDASSQTQGVSLNLNAGSWSQIGVAFWNGQANVRDCLTIAYGCTIENAIGSNYADTLQGNAVSNSLWGLDGNDTIFGGAGSDVLGGNAGNDVIDGGGDNDVLYGGTGNDVVNGGGGSDTLNRVEGRDVMYGGTGSDVLQLTVISAQADILKLRTNSFFIKDDAGNLAIVRDVEQIQYTDNTVGLGSVGLFENVNLQLVEIYMAAFNRAPETGGYEYWVARVATEGILNVANVIFSIPSVLAIYPQDMTSEEFVTAIYQNVLDKAPDAAGLAYWVNSLNAPGGSRGKLVLDLAGAALNTADGTSGKDFFQNRVDWGMYAVAYQELTGNEFAPSYSETLTETVNADGMTLVNLIGQTVGELTL